MCLCLCVRVSACECVTVFILEGRLVYMIKQGSHYLRISNVGSVYPPDVPGQSGTNQVVPSTPRDTQEPIRERKSGNVSILSCLYSGNILGNIMLYTSCTHSSSYSQSPHYMDNTSLPLTNRLSLSFRRANRSARFRPRDLLSPLNSSL